MTDSACEEKTVIARASLRICPESKMFEERSGTPERRATHQIVVLSLGEGNMM